MKRIRVAAISLVVIAALVLSASPIMAAKPLDVIPKSNGFPSGQHFNLNIHGVDDPANFTIPEEPYGASIFTSLYSGDDPVTETIQYESGRRATVTELTVTDPVTQAFDGDAAVVQLPYQEKGYYVFARILANLKHNREHSYGFGKRKWLTSRVTCSLCGRKYNLREKNGCACIRSDPMKALRHALTSRSSGMLSVQRSGTAS